MKREAREFRDKICRAYFGLYVTEGPKTFCASAYTAAKWLGISEKEVLKIWEKEGFDPDVRDPPERWPLYCKYLERKENREKRNAKGRYAWNYPYTNSLMSGVLRNDMAITLETICKKLKQQGRDVEKAKVEKNLDFLMSNHYVNKYRIDGTEKYKLATATYEEAKNDT